VYCEEAANHNSVLIELFSLSDLLQLLEHFISLSLVVNDPFVCLGQAFSEAASYLHILFSEFIQSDSTVVIAVNHAKYVLNDTRVKVDLRWVNVFNFRSFINLEL
jgi:hypothetical protein